MSAHTAPLPCPFCGDQPWFEGDGSDWKDDCRYVEMSLECCSRMTAAIGWRRARGMTAGERREELRAKLIAKWNVRHTKEPQP